MLHRRRKQHGKLPSWYRFAFSIAAIISLIVPPDHLGFAHNDVRVMTDENPSDLPTKENIVSCLHELLLLALNSFSWER
jgi:hypothetical protein